MADVLIDQEISAKDVTDGHFLKTCLFNATGDNFSIEAAHQETSPNIIFAIQSHETEEVKTYSVSLSDLALIIANKAFVDE